MFVPRFNIQLFSPSLPPDPHPDFGFASASASVSQFIGDHLLSTRGGRAPKGRKAIVRKWPWKKSRALSRNATSLTIPINTHKPANSDMVLDRKSTRLNSSH